MFWFLAIPAAIIIFILLYIFCIKGINKINPNTESNVVVDANDEVISISESEICNICLENIDKELSTISLTSCKHLFHKKCLIRWLDAQDEQGLSPTCSTCRSYPSWIKYLN